MNIHQVRDEIEDFLGGVLVGVDRFVVGHTSPSTQAYWYDLTRQHDQLFDMALRAVDDAFVHDQEDCAYHYRLWDQCTRHLCGQKQEKEAFLAAWMMIDRCCQSAPRLADVDAPLHWGSFPTLMAANAADVIADCADTRDPGFAAMALHQVFDLDRLIRSRHSRRHEFSGDLMKKVFTAAQDVVDGGIRSNDDLEGAHYMCLCDAAAFAAKTGNDGFSKLARKVCYRAHGYEGRNFLPQKQAEYPWHKTHPLDRSTILLGLGQVLEVTSDRKHHEEDSKLLAVFHATAEKAFMYSAGMTDDITLITDKLPPRAKGIFRTVCEMYQVKT